MTIVVRHEHFFHIDGDDARALTAIHKTLASINEKLATMSAELDTLTTEVSETGTVVESAIVLLKGLKAKLDAAGTDPVKLKELSDSLNSQQEKLAAAIAENTPAEPPTEEPAA